MSFVIGAIAACVLALVFSFKTKGFTRLGVNLIVGTIVTVALSLFGALPLNAINAFIIGLLGVPGLIAILLIVTFF